MEISKFSLILAQISWTAAPDPPMAFTSASITGISSSGPSRVATAWLELVPKMAVPRSFRKKMVDVSGWSPRNFGKNGDFCDRISEVDRFMLIMMWFLNEFDGEFFHGEFGNTQNDGAKW